MIYVSFVENHKRKTGWVKEKEPVNDYVEILREDGYGGTCAISLHLSEITIEPKQKPGPLGHAYFGTYFKDIAHREVVGKYHYSEDGLVIYQFKNGKYVEIS